MPDLRRLVLTAQGVIMAIMDTAKLQIRLVDAETDRLAGLIPLAPGQSFPTAFDVTSDFRLAAYLADSGTNQPGTVIEVWDRESNASRLRLSPGLGTVRHLDFSPDMRFLACTAEYGVIVFETSHFSEILRSGA